MPLNELCLNCSIGYMKEPDTGQESYLQCSECSAVEMTYKPMPHQASFHADNAKFKGFFGGYG